MTRNADSYRAKIKALVAKANDAAASEAEATAAMNRAARLMSDFGLTLEDITGDDAETVIVLEGEIITGRLATASRYCLGTIGRFCGVRYFTKRSRDRRGNLKKAQQIKWVGYAADCELAEYMWDVVGRAIMTESRAYQGTGRDRDDFACGMADRIACRIRSLIEENAPQPNSDGHSLVELKSAAVEDAYEKLDLSKARAPRTRLVDAAALASGSAAGDRVALHRSMSHKKGQLALPGK